MKLLFVCGGTAGHINPALAVASWIRDRRPDAVIRFAGDPTGMEARLVPEAGFEFAPFRAMGLQRRLTLHNIGYNLRSAALLLTAAPRARRVIRDFGPDVVAGTGGYVTAPVLLQAARMGVRTCTQEQNAFPGVTTKMLAGKVDTVMLATEAAEKYLPQDRAYIVTGNPVRGEIFSYDRARARRELGIPEGVFCLLSFGGSLGAQRVNEAVAAVMAWHCAGRAPQPVRHIHATGAYGVELLPRLLAGTHTDPKNKNLDIREYISDMPRCLAAADLVICRAGASTLSELQAAGRASILIPSPNVAENHQYHNAMALARQGAAVVLEEKDLTGERLIAEVAELMRDPKRLAGIAEAAKRGAVRDSAERIAREILSLADCQESR